MPGVEHETMVLALREDRSLLRGLLALAGRRVSFRGMTVEDTAVRWVASAEVRPDLLLSGPKGAWLAVEVQRQIDRAKARRWLLLTAVLADQRGVMGDLLVVTASASVARWARRLRRRGRIGGEVQLKPTVVLLAGGTLEALLDPKRPSLAFLAAWAMQDRRGAAAKRVVRRALALTEALPEALRQAQVRAILNVLSAPMLAYLKEAAVDINKIPESPWVKAWRLELEAKGKVEGKAEAVLAVLAARGIAVSDVQSARVLACQHRARLDAWLRVVATVASTDELLATACAS
ncbi:MAG: hypothetical protein HY909_03230 [Deltaproteobacteria bacterium]|nr:hypothetical protein [Deltaproteobacteria bacterium]